MSLSEGTLDGKNEIDGKLVIVGISVEDSVAGDPVGVTEVIVGS
jgi:hypothetical protein